ncbi:ANK1 [Symbiodinium sp. CCMP2592]|nr:ANK1 [Symbiodinium sp. CCMP2592]
MAPAFAILASDDAGAKVAGKNSAAAGIQLFQMFSSTSALLGLSRSADYSASNANLNCLINFRRTNAINGQSNMWGEIQGTGLAGGGTGAAGRHGDTSQGATAASEAYTPEGLPRKLPKTPEPDFVSKYPPSYYHRDPARADLTLSMREASNPTEMQHKTNFSSMEKEGFAAVRGLQVSLKTKEKDDKVLLIANLPTSTQEQHDGVSWALKRGEQTLGPVHTTWTHDLGRVDGLCLPWLDSPGRAGLDCEYSVCGRLKGSVQLSQQNERRQLAAVLLQNVQVASAESCEAMAVQPGRWYDVPGLNQISYTNKGEKVLVFCTIRYTALWSDEMTRGRFSIFRDGQALDPEHFGLQSVRSMQKGLKRVAVMTVMDDPQEGPHLYEVRAAVTAEEGETRVCHLDAAPRQLGLLRLPGSSVSGPYRMKAASVVEEDQWTELPGLSATVTTTKAHQKVLLVWSTNFNPDGLTYESYFTVMRSSLGGPMRNLGSDSQGLWSVSSEAAGSSEYPASMSIDSPGIGTYTYTVHCRTRRCGSLTEPMRVEVGPDGHIAAVLLNAKFADSRNVVEMMGKEMDAARSEQ